MPNIIADSYSHLATFHHFGLAISEFSNALKFYKNLGYQCTDVVFDPLQNVELILCTSSLLPAVELIKPVNEKSPIVNLLSKNNELIYHICYELSSFDEDIKKFFEGSRTICVSNPKPSQLFNSRLAAFYYVKDVGLIEILEKQRGFQSENNSK